MNTIPFDQGTSIVDTLSSSLREDLRGKVKRAFAGVDCSVYSPIFLFQDKLVYEELNGYIIMNVDGVTKKTTREMANAFFFSYLYPDDSMSFEDFYLLMLSLPAIMTFQYDENKQKESKHESGQAKILLGTLEALTNLPESLLTIAVVGSASDERVVSGLTYDLLAENLSVIGYHGTMLLIDPVEVPSERQIGKFRVIREKRYHDYDMPILVDGAPPVVIFDDVFESVDNEKKVDFETDFRPLRCKDPIKLQGGVRKFTILKGEYFDMECNLMSHIASKRPACGGGTIFTSHEEKYIEVYGTSGNFGPYPRVQVLEFLTHYYPKYRIEVSRSSQNISRPLDPDWKIVRNNPYSRVSAKYYGEPLPGLNYRIVSQHYYHGHERRVFFRVPLMLQPPIMYGDRCSDCRYMSQIIGNITQFSSAPREVFVPNTLHAVLGHTCVRVNGQKFQKLVQLCQNYARREATINELYDDLNYPEDMVDRALRFLINKKLCIVDSIGLPPGPSYELVGDSYTDGMYVCKHVNDKWVYTFKGVVSQHNSISIIKLYNGSANFNIKKLYSLKKVSVLNVSPIINKFPVWYPERFASTYMSKKVSPIFDELYPHTIGGDQRILYLGNEIYINCDIQITYRLSIAEFAEMSSIKTVEYRVGDFVSWKTFKNDAILQTHNDVYDPQQYVGVYEGPTGKCLVSIHGDGLVIDSPKRQYIAEPTVKTLDGFFKILSTFVTGVHFQEGFFDLFMVFGNSEVPVRYLKAFVPDEDYEIN